MDLFSNIDWTLLKSAIEDLSIIVQYSENNCNSAKKEILKLVYTVDSEIHTLKKELQLPRLDNVIKSDSVLTSITQLSKFSELFENGALGSSDYFRQNDYQFWLLIFLLLKHNEIRENQLTLFQIIDEFIEKVSQKSFSFEDIVLTGSGATRCRTNLRFAFNDLKKVGLVNLYDMKHRNSWTLTYLGFFIAASFVLDPLKNVPNPFTSKITKFNQSTWYFKINKNIIERIKELSEPKYFNEILTSLKIDNLGLNELLKGDLIFSDYFNFVKGINQRGIKASLKQKELEKFLIQLNGKNALDKYMEQLSMKFNAEEFFKNLMESFKKQS